MKKLKKWMLSIEFEELAKVLILSFMLTMGFWVTYAIIWFAVGLPQTNWAMWGLFCLALLSVYGYCKWLSN